MTDLELAELARLVDAATPGPWRWVDGDPRDSELRKLLGSEDRAVLDFGSDEQYYPSAGEEPSNADAALIAAARTALPALVAFARECKEVLREMAEGPGVAVSSDECVGCLRRRGEHTHDCALAALIK